MVYHDSASADWVFVTSDSVWEPALSVCYVSGDTCDADTDSVVDVAPTYDVTDHSSML